MTGNSWGRQGGMGLVIQSAGLPRCRDYAPGPLCPPPRSIMKAVPLHAGTPCQLQASGSPGSLQVTPTLTRLAATPSPQRSAQRRPQSFRIEALSPASAASSSPGTPCRSGRAPAAALPLTPADTNVRRGAHSPTFSVPVCVHIDAVTPASRALLQ